MRARTVLRLALAGLLATAPVAAALPAAADDPPIVYAALGDSSAAGAGSNTLPYDLDLACGRTQGAYPVLWANTHDVAEFDFAACGGATSLDVVNNQLGVLSADTTLVTVTAGGNDVGAVQALVTCSIGTQSACLSAIDTMETQAETILPDRFDDMFQAIKAAAPNAEVIVMGYPGVFELTPTCALLTPNLTERTAYMAAGQTIRNILVDRAAANGVTYTDPFTQFAGHRICSADPWINALVAVGIPYHPNTAGYAQGYLPALNAVTG